MKRKNYLGLLFSLLTLSLTMQAGETYNVKKYGAKGNGRKMDSPAIQKAIDDNVLTIYKGKAKLMMSELKDSDAAVLGASALGWELRDIK